jgi:hypothetical protein
MASRYWVGGSGTWDASDQTHWAAASGGAGGQTVPTSADDVVFDANSGGTITVSGNKIILSLSAGLNFPGTLDFNGYDVSVTNALSFSDFFNVAKTIRLGSGTFSCDTLALNDGTATTFQAGTSRVKVRQAGTPTTSFGINLTSPFTWATIEVGPDTSWPLHTFSGAPVITSLELKGPVKLRGNVTIAATNLIGTASAKGKGAEMRGEPTQSWDVANPATLHWAVLRGLNFIGAAARAYNSMDGGGNSGITFSPPKYGRVIGG